MKSRLTEAITATIDLAENNADIKAIVSFGSTNRKKVDENSDLDIFIFTTDRARYLDKNQNQWLLESFGNILSRVIVEELMDQILFNRIVLENEFSLDIITVDISEFRTAKYFLWLKKVGLSTVIPKKLLESVDKKLYTFHYYLKRGYQILYDQVNIKSLIERIFDAYKHELYQERNNLINENTFERNYNQFWQSCCKMNLELERGHYFQALNVHDHEIKKSLIQMVYWHTLLDPNNKDLDVFYKGAKIYDWCDESIIQQLYSIFPHQDFPRMTNAIDQSILVYQQLSHPIALSKGFKINSDLETLISKSIKKPQCSECKINCSKQHNLPALLNANLEFYKSEAYNDMFYNNYNQFWQYCYKMMVKLIRNDFYYAIFILDNNIKKRLSEMIDWLNDLKTYAGEPITSQIDIAAMIASGIYPHSSINEMKASIQKTIWAYKRISHQVALKAGLSVNPNFEQVVEAFINDNLIIQT
ncbi:aminoglycoside 6-adenylyltransferase [Pedobacter endophyticus]|uniref:Aminoglycoside 6-adenylyltransferase n=1 Tax=Pedobacter endophyticus TaxID=2789740 RepID=A0A7U3SPN5_9SPHI|nr:aminoglycoside 6-adenylyltransferase [Pedobacter endophyticus]QPH38256.1 aminoglycoside 6-adenylyltransferase [Pedobacter endophyticus]